MKAESAKIDDIVDWLIIDGYIFPSIETNWDRVYELASTLKRASQKGCLVWTEEHIVCTLANDEFTLFPKYRPN